MVYRKRLWIFVWRINREITRLTNRTRVSTVDLHMKHFAWLWGSLTEIKCSVCFLMKKVILRFRVMSNPSHVKISQNIEDPDFQMSTNFLRNEKCLWSGTRNWFNSPTINGKFRKSVLKRKLCSVLAMYEWWFWNSLLFRIVKKLTVCRPNRAISWEKVEHLTFDWKVKWSSHVDFTIKFFASMLEYLFWNTDLKKNQRLWEKLIVASLSYGDFACWILQFDVM